MQRKKGLLYRTEEGSIVIIVALSLVVLIGVLALVLDGGYLYATRAKYQNGVEAAALAGAHHFADGYDDEGELKVLSISRNIAEENGIPSAADIETTVGVYDEETGQFEGDPDSSTSLNEAVSSEGAPTLNNAVKVTVTHNISTFLAGVFGKNTVKVYSQAMAYGKRYTFMATGEEDVLTSGLNLSGVWTEGYNIYQNCLLGSNGPVLFAGESYETFDNSSIEVLDGVDVTGADGKVDIVSLANALENSPINWDALRKRAQENGVVYTEDELDGWSSEWNQDEYGNCYRRVADSNVYGVSTINYCFIPAGRDDNDLLGSGDQGDHQGRTYFFEIPEDPPEGYSYIIRIFNNDADACVPEDRTCWNFTLAARCGVSSYPLPPSGPYYQMTTLGNVPEYGDRGIVYIYAKECTGYSKNWYTRYNTIKITEPNGVVFHLEGDFEMYAQRSGGDGPFYFRLYANHIRIYSPTWRASSIVFDGNFGPLDKIRLGKIDG